jgi:hypothetical protein
LNPTSCTELGDFVESLGDKKYAAAKTKVRTVNEDFAVREDIKVVLRKFGGDDQA